MNIAELIAQHLPDDVLAQIAKSSAGIEDQQQGITASKSVIQTILQGLSNNTAQSQGAGSLLGALDRDHDGSILDDVIGLVTGQVTTANPSTTNGMGILNHILGGRQDQTSNQIGQILGMDSSKILSLLSTFAPLIMGMLGKMRSSGQIDQTNIQQVLGSTVESHSNAMPNLGILGKLLDQNNDGNITDDLLQMGMKFLGRK